MPTSSAPILTVQLAALWASGDSSTFIGAGGPAAYDPFLGLFNGVVSSQGIFAEPFSEQVRGVDAGDQVVFVIAVQNFASDSSAYGIKLRNSLPLGFMVPADGGGVIVSDGAGNLLNASGNLFDSNGGLTILDPIAPYSDNSGTNVLLVTFTLEATAAISVPLANVTDSARIVSYAASPGGPDLSASSPTVLFRATAVQTSPIQAFSSADQPAAPLASGQTASYDITVTLPEGTTRDLRIDELLPHSGASWFSFASAEIVHFGAHLTASSPVVAAPDGSVSLGTVVNAPDGLQTAADQIVLRVTVANGGMASGTGILNTTVSAADPNTAQGRWSTTLADTLALAKPDIAPTIGGISPSQNATSTMQVLPFAGVVLADPDFTQVQTLTIHLSDPSLGSLSGSPSLAATSSGDLALTGTIDAVQAAVRSLVFTPVAGATGIETFSLTLNDGASGVATDSRTTLSLAASANTNDLARFPMSAQTVLTSTAAGSSTVAQVEAYAGPVDNIKTQFIYDGSAPLAIVAGQSGMLISSKAAATAIQLKDGANVLDMQFGSSFVVSGTGADVILLHADQTQTTWNTVANFHPGDSITLYGFTAGRSSDWWQENAGAPGYTGATLHADINGDGKVDSSLTFTGMTLANASRFSLQTGNVAGSDYLLITTPA